MSEIASLIREFPFGSFLIITSAIAGVTSVARAFVNRNKPVCECDCCIEHPDCEDDVEVDDEED